MKADSRLSSSPMSKKHLLLLELNDQNQIARKLLQLEDNPYIDAKKLKDTDFWRLSVGNYRIIYIIDKGVFLVLVIWIGLWKDIYRHL